MYELATLDDHAYVTSLGERNFYSHRPTQLLAEALLHRIGKAVSRLEGGFVAEHRAVEWQKMQGMQNVVAHGYGFIDHRIVWRALSDVLPNDAAAIESILRDGRTSGSRVTGLLGTALEIRSGSTL